MRRVIMGLVLLALACPALAVAQTGYERPRGSIFAALHLGAGWGQAYVDASGETVAETDAQLGAYWGFRVGTAMSEVVALSIDYFGYASVDDEPAGFDRVESEAWLIGPSLNWYPGAGGLYLKGTVGWGGVDFRVANGDAAARATEEGLGLGAGIGYEIPLNPRLSLGAQADYVWMNVGDVTVADGLGGTESADFNFAIWGFSAFVLINY